jgi:hypothetical protein
MVIGLVLIVTVRDGAAFIDPNRYFDLEGETKAARTNPSRANFLH